MVGQLFEILFLSVTLINMGYWLLFMRFGLSGEEEAQRPDTWPSVSIVVCAKNESQNLNEHLPLWLSQHYDGDWELLVVNDNSTDDTVEILGRNAHGKLRHINMNYDDPSLPGKRNALKAGIKAAHYDVLLLTDADCKPSSGLWLESMAKHLGKKDMVLGVGLYEEKKGLLNQYIRLEAIWTAIQYLSFAHIGKPYMGVGRNMMYRKTLFERTGGFEPTTSLSGDDDLMVQRMVAAGAKTAICYSPESHTISKAKNTLHDYLTQKSRHFGAGRHYPITWRLVLGILFFTNSLILPLAGACILMSRINLTISALLAIRSIAVAIAWRIISKKISNNSATDATHLLFDSSLPYLYLLAPFFFKHRKIWK